jgi:hypothetical protein
LCFKNLQAIPTTKSARSLKPFLTEKPINGLLH